MMKIKFETPVVSFVAQLNSTLAAQEIASKLPIESNISKWGDEIYFEIDFKASSEGATMDVCVGDVAYWSQGKCLCVFYGPTMDSTDEKPVPASPVVIIGKTDAQPSLLRQIQLGEPVVVSLV